MSCVSGAMCAKVPEDAEKVLVAVGATREISKAGLLWTLNHVVQPGCCITLLVVIPPRASVKKLWAFPMFAGNCVSGYKQIDNGTTLDLKSDIADRLNQMINQLKNLYDPDKVSLKRKIVFGTPGSVITAECRSAQATWLVLDKQPKDEEKKCMEELQCNIVSMKRSHAKVLRLNLCGLPDEEDASVSTLAPVSFEAVSEKLLKEKASCGSDVASSDSFESGAASSAGTSSISSSDRGNSPLSVPDSVIEIDKKEPQPLLPNEEHNLVVTSSDSDSGSPSPTAMLEFHPRALDYLRTGRSSTSHVMDKISRQRIAEFDPNSSVREAISLTRNVPQVPPPLCSICQHKSPEFGKPPRWFSYTELEQATGGFSKANFLAEGGFGSVHRGALPDGQAIAVKQHKLASTQGDNEFCAEVEVLSCAQHRNVVTLIGICIEDNKRLLVYEFICNGSLDAHLYGQDRELLQWSARQKIAVGAARGLRYLHEDCRVGCIVHRDMRPSNILVTHNFEPLVGDFGLARWQPDGDSGVHTRVIGTFGYLAPEYAQTGQITEKADVYSFGVVLLELVTGRKAIDISGPRGQQCLTEWARPLLKKFAVDELIDPRLGSNYSKQEVCCMLQAASMCMRRDPHLRPRMSQVLNILEGHMIVEKTLYMPSPAHDKESRCVNGRSLSFAQSQQRRLRLLHENPNCGVMHSPNASMTNKYRQAATAERRRRALSFQEGELSLN